VKEVRCRKSSIAYFSSQMDIFLGVLLLFFGGTGVWSQGFAHRSHTLYCLSHSSSPFALFILEIGSPFSAQVTLDYNPHILCFLLCHHTQLFPIEMGSFKHFFSFLLFFFFWLELVWNCDLPVLSLPVDRDDKCHCHPIQLLVKIGSH
jgi:hypothetical protein